MKFSPNSLGIVFVIAGLALFSVQDLILRLASGSYPLHQAMVLRSLAAIPFMLWIVHRFDGSLATLLAPGWPAMLARGLLNFAAYATFYLGLASLDFANNSALSFTSPLVITLLSVLVLKEKVPRSRWLAVLLGLAGVVILVGPTASLFEWAALLPLVSGFCYGAWIILARIMGARQSAGAMAFWSNMTFLLLALMLSAIFGTGAYNGQGHASLAFLMRGWVNPSWSDLALMCLCGPIAAFGLTLLTQAYRIANASLVAPFEYSAIFWGLLWGWLVFGQWPEGREWAGIAIIIGAGLYITRTESRAAAGPPSA